MRISYDASPVFVFVPIAIVVLVLLAVICVIVAVVIINKRKNNPSAPRLKPTKTAKSDSTENAAVSSAP
jgi:flagellar basal body-associated protein FliL